MIPEFNESSLLEMATERAKEVHKKDCTSEFVQEQSKLIKAALEMIDISNIFLGPYSNTALQKIDECLEVLGKNFEEISESKQKKIMKKLIQIQKILNDKNEYGKDVDAFLAKRESNLVDIIKDRLLDADLVEYEKIMNKMSHFKTTLVKSATELCILSEKL